MKDLKNDAINYIIGFSFDVRVLFKSFSSIFYFTLFSIKCDSLGKTVLELFLSYIEKAGCIIHFVFMEDID